MPRWRLRENLEFVRWLRAERPPFSDDLSLVGRASFIEGKNVVSAAQIRRWWAFITMSHQYIQSLHQDDDISTPHLSSFEPD